MLYLIGLGLSGPTDLSIKAMDVINKCDEIYFENYTSPIDLSDLERVIGRKAIKLDRADVEEGNMLIEKAKKFDIAFLVPGDPLTATTHQEIVLRARRNGIRVEVIHSSSIITAVCETGLHIYKFGRVVSIPKISDIFHPKSPYYYLKENLDRGLHTLLLIDPDSNVKEAVKYLFSLEKMEKKGVVDENTMGILISFGKEKVIKYDLLHNLDCDQKPQALVIPGDLHFTEKEFLGEIHGEKARKD